MIPWGTHLSTERRCIWTLILGCICYIIVYLLLSMTSIGQMSWIRPIVSYIWILFIVDISVFYYLNKKILCATLINLLNLNHQSPSTTTPSPPSTTPPSPPSPSPTPPSPNNRFSNIPTDGNLPEQSGDLDIDLLTEHHKDDNENDPSKQVCTTNEKEVSHDTVCDQQPKPVSTSSNHSPHDSQTSQCQSDLPESDATPPADLSTHVDPLCPKLTEENLNKFVKNKAKIQLRTSVNSEDLVL